MNILIEKNDNILKYIELLNLYDYKITKLENIFKLKKKYSLYLIYLDSDSKFKYIENTNLELSKVLAFTNNINKNFFWNINMNLNCIDIININNSTDSILERINSNLYKEEAYEKDINNNNNFI